jgi:putative ABC transport system ATP-binding protein
MATQPLISLSDVAFAYDRAGERPFSLLVPSLQCPPGQISAVIGPSGSGKTTLLHLICGVLAPSRGNIHLFNHNLSLLSPPQRRALRLDRVGMVFQEFELLEYLSARDNILLHHHVASRTTINPRELEAHAMHLVEQAGISHLLHRKPARLSQGERQRVAVCRALATRPDLILCDEPTGNLDPASTARILDLIIKQARDTDATLLVVTHNHTTLERFDTVIDIRDFAEGHAQIAPQVSA